jgi:hypothetical protein
LVKGFELAEDKERMIVRFDEEDPSGAPFGRTPQSPRAVLQLIPQPHRIFADDNGCSAMH